MAKHRSLSNALLSPEKMAFIKGEEASAPSRQYDQQPVVQAEPVIVPVVDLASDVRTPSETPRRTQEAKAPQSSHRREVVEVSATISSNEEYLVPVTTRLQARTADALRRAHLEQKLNRRNPATQQEIIELAVQEWLRHHSFLE